VADSDGEATAAIFLFDDIAPHSRPAALAASEEKLATGRQPQSEETALQGRQIQGQENQGQQNRDKPSVPSSRVRRLQVTSGVAAAVLLMAVVATVVESSLSTHPSRPLAAAVTSRSGGASRATSKRTGAATPTKQASPGRKSTPTRGAASKGRTGAAGSRIQVSSTVEPTEVTPYDATVAAPSSPYVVVVSVTADCWVEGEQTATSTDIWSGVLAGGSQHSFRFDGSVLLRIGAADATVTMNGKSVALPSDYQAPYNLTFTSS